MKSEIADRRFSKNLHMTFGRKLTTTKRNKLQKCWSMMTIKRKRFHSTQKKTFSIDFLYALQPVKKIKNGERGKKRSVSRWGSLLNECVYVCKRRRRFSFVPFSITCC